MTVQICYDEILNWVGDSKNRRRRIDQFVLIIWDELASKMCVTTYSLESFHTSISKFQWNCDKISKFKYSQFNDGVIPAISFLYYNQIWQSCHKGRHRQGLGMQYRSFPGKKVIKCWGQKKYPNKGSSEKCVREEIQQKQRTEARESMANPRNCK